MTGREAYKIWAPAGAGWVEWVKPVPFIEPGSTGQIMPVINFTIPDIYYSDGLTQDTAVIVDLPGYESVNEGIALARLGFRPIPLYNGTYGQQGAMALVDNHSIHGALLRGASELAKTTLCENSPPAFLADSNRLHRHKMSVSVFDNSWDLYDQDFPSAECFLGNGINRIVVRGEKIHKDLAGILYKFRKKGIAVFLTNGYENPKEVRIKKPRGG